MTWLCNIHRTPAKTVPAGISKLGKGYPAFEVCSTPFCKEKPPQVPSNEIPLSDEEPIDQAIKAQAEATKAPETPQKPKEVDWDQIAEGKVRHGIAVAFITALGSYQIDTKIEDLKLTDSLKKTMLEWVEWIIKGE